MDNLDVIKRKANFTSRLIVADILKAFIKLNTLKVIFSVFIKTWHVFVCIFVS